MPTGLTKQDIANIREEIDSLHFMDFDLPYPEVCTPLGGMTGAAFDLLHSRPAAISLRIKSGTPTSTPPTSR